MTYCYKNTIEIEEKDSSRLENLTKILNVEYESESLQTRSKTKIVKKEKRVIIEIKAKDIVALRSSINGLIKVLYTFNKVSNLTR